MKTKDSVPFGTGISSLLMIFVVLCLTVFGVLAYMTARADDRLTQRSAQMVQAYYTADAKAEEALAVLDEALEKMPPQKALETAGFTLLQTSRVTSGEMEIPVSGTRIYQLIVTVQGKNYQVIVRQTRDDAVWEEEHLDVWDGQ